MPLLPTKTASFGDNAQSQENSLLSKITYKVVQENQDTYCLTPGVVLPVLPTPAPL